MWSIADKDIFMQYKTVLVIYQVMKKKQFLKI